VGRRTVAPTIEIRAGDIERALGAQISHLESAAILRGLGFAVVDTKGSLVVTAPSSRPDVRSGVAGRADVIEEIARLHSYLRLPRHTPTWPEPGASTLDSACDGRYRTSPSTSGRTSRGRRPWQRR